MKELLDNITKTFERIAGIGKDIETKENEIELMKIKRLKYLNTMEDGKGPDFMSKSFTGIAFVSFNHEDSIFFK